MELVAEAFQLSEEVGFVFTQSTGYLGNAINFPAYLPLIRNPNMTYTDTIENTTLLSYPFSYTPPWPCSIIVSSVAWALHFPILRNLRLRTIIE